jgi:hypothetical protein
MMKTNTSRVLSEILFGIVAVLLYAAIILAAFKQPLVVATLGALMLLNLRACERLRRVVGSGILGSNDAAGPR